MLIAITYHYVRPHYRDCPQGIVGITVEDFARQLELVSRQGVFVSQGDVDAHVRGGRRLPARSLLVTFDDGLAEQYEHAWTVLRRMGIPAIFFVNTQPVAEATVCAVHKVHLMRAAAAPEEFHRVLLETAGRLGIDLDRPLDPRKCATQYPYDTEEVGRIKYLINFELSAAERTRLIEAAFAQMFPGREGSISRDFYMTGEQMKNLAGSGALGTHGHDHLPIGQLTPEAARESILESARLLELWTGSRPLALSYPYGTRDTCSPVTGRIAGEAGIRLGFTVESAGNDDESFRNPQFLGRFDCNLVEGGKKPLARLEAVFVRSGARWHAAANPLRKEATCGEPLALSS